MKITSHFFSLLLLLLFSLVVQAQENSFKILSFTIDSKPIKNYSVIFAVDGKELRPRREVNEVFIPEEITKTDEVKIQFQAKGHTFEFGPFTNFNNIKANFIVGIDEKPFDQKNVSEDDADKISIAYFLERIPTSMPNSNSLANSWRFVYRVPNEVSETKTPITKKPLNEGAVSNKKSKLVKDRNSNKSAKTFISSFLSYTLNIFKPIKRLPELFSSDNNKQANSQKK